MDKVNYQYRRWTMERKELMYLLYNTQMEKKL